MSVHRIGLLAYGSLRWDRDEELESMRDFERPLNGQETRFQVEFARSSSRTRHGGPTLVPVETGGASIPATVFAFREELELEEAQTLVWKRETGLKSGHYNPLVNVGPDKVYVEPLETTYVGFDTVLGVRIGPNIEDLSREVLAALAIQSAMDAGAEEQDGISYLIKCKQYGVETPLTAPYKEALLRRLGVGTLVDARRAARALVDQERAPH
jgi:hypothetical protein